MVDLKLYYWDTEIGQMLALAVNVDQARQAVMGTLSKDDFARDELRAAIAIEPEIITEPRAIVAYIP